MRGFHEARRVAGASAEVRYRDAASLGSLQNFLGGAMRVGAIDSAALVKWLSWVGEERGFAPSTMQQFRSPVSTFFRHLLLTNVIKWNPCAAARAPKVVPKEISVLGVADAARLFEANRGRPCLTKLALEAFGGLRKSSAVRLSREDVDWENRGLVFPAAKLKTKRAQYVEGFPDNLWEWLRAAPAEAWGLSKFQYTREKTAAFRRAGVVNPGNVLRHSFASYHVALHKDAARTAVLLCHTSPAMLWRHYKGRATAADAAKWFAILPPGGRLNLRPEFSPR